MAESETQSPPLARRPRWGLRTMGFLILVMVALITATTQGHHTVGTAGSTFFGIIGAGYCSIRGVRDAQARGVYGLLMDRRHGRP